MMGWKDARSGLDIYSYQRLMNDMNTLYPYCVRNLQEMREVMVGRFPPPRYWEKPINELLELAVTGMRNPPSAGPFWHPVPITKVQRRRAADVLGAWMYRARMDNKTLAEAAEIMPSRVGKLRNALTPILPTELDRIAAVFATDRNGFLRGPESPHNGSSDDSRCAR